MKVLRLIASAAVVGLVAAACSGGTSGTNDSAPEPGVDDPTVGATAAAQITCEQVNPGQPLGQQVVCTVDVQSSAHMVNIADVIAEANSAAHADDPVVVDSTPMWIQAWGGAGMGSSSTGEQAPGGAGGFAQTVTSPGDYATFGSSELWFWVADVPHDSDGWMDRAGGASTIVANFNPTSTDFLTTSQGLILIAGGGGSGAISHSNKNGGAGGVAISTMTAPATVAGGSGVDEGGGQGGNPSGNGGAGAGGSDHDPGGPGDGGIGGRGGRSATGESGNVGWINGGPVLDGTNPGQGGLGADGGDLDGAGGGGGYGGGGGGGGSSFTAGSAGAGGGGGSWAVISHLCDTNAAIVDNFPDNPGPSFQSYSYGFIRIIFDLDPQPC